MNILRNIYRLLKKEKAFGIINIAGLSVGISMCILIVWYISYHITSDSYHPDVDQLYCIVSKDKNSGSLSFGNPLPMVHVIQNDFSGVGEVAAMSGNYTCTVEVKVGKFQVKGAVATQNIFNILGFNLISGRPEQVLAEPGSAVITEGCAAKLFGEPEAVGKVIQVETPDGIVPVTVSAVMENLPLNSNYSPEILLNWESLNPPNWRELWWWTGTHIFAKVKNEEQRFELQEKINTILETYNAKFIKGRFEYELIPLKQAHFRTDIANSFSPGISSYLMWVLAIIAFVILVVASINFINLAISQSGKYAKQTGISKVLGATSKRIGFEFLTGTFIKVLIAILASIVLVTFLAGPFRSIADIKEITPFNNPFIWIILISMLFVIAILAGAYPAFVLSRPTAVKLISAKKVFAFSNSSIQKPLIVIQFIIANALIVGVLFIFKQITFMKDHDLGFNKEGLVGINIGVLDNDRKQLERKATLLKEEIEKYSEQSGIISIANTEAIPGTGFKNAFTVFNLENNDSYSVTAVAIDEDYSNVFEIPVVEGKNFLKGLQSNSGAILINETLKQKLGWESIEGKELAVHDKKYKGPVVGVLKDVNINSLNQSIPPMIFLYKGYSYPQYMSLRIKSGKEKEALAVVKKEWKKLAEEEALDSFVVAEKFNQMYGSEERLSKIIGAFCLIAIFLSCFGLLAYTTLMAQQRTKEIGIRKVNGAKISEILTMLNKDFIKWVVIAFFIACPLAYYLMNKWLENFAYKTTLSWWIFALSGVLALGIALLTVSFQSYKAATRNPIESLRYE